MTQSETVLNEKNNSSLITRIDSAFLSEYEILYLKVEYFDPNENTPDSIEKRPVPADAIKTITQWKISKKDETIIQTEKAAKVETERSQYEKSKEDITEKITEEPAPDTYRWRYIFYLLLLLVAVAIFIYFKGKPFLKAIRKCFFK